MVGSYLLSSTFVPVVSVWLLRHFHYDERDDATLFADQSIATVLAS